MAICSGGLNAIHVERLRGELHSWIDEHLQSPVFLLDFQEVQMIDSSGLGLLVGLLKVLRTRGSEIHICGATQKVKMVFHVTRTQKFFPFHDSVTDAMQDEQEHDAP